MKDKKISQMIHDIKSLITSIHAYNQLLQRQLIKKNDTESLTYSLHIGGQIKKLISLVEKPLT